MVVFRFKGVDPLMKLNFIVIIYFDSVLGTGMKIWNSWVLSPLSDFTIGAIF